MQKINLCGCWPRGSMVVCYTVIFWPWLTHTLSHFYQTLMRWERSPWIFYINGFSLGRLASYEVIRREKGQRPWLQIQATFPVWEGFLLGNHSNSRLVASPGSQGNLHLQSIWSQSRIEQTVVATGNPPTSVCAWPSPRSGMLWRTYRGVPGWLSRGARHSWSWGSWVQVPHSG